MPGFDGLRRTLHLAPADWQGTARAAYLIQNAEDPDVRAVSGEFTQAMFDSASKGGDPLHVIDAYWKAVPIGKGATRGEAFPLMATVAVDQHLDTPLILVLNNSCAIQFTARNELYAALRVAGSKALQP